MSARSSSPRAAPPDDRRRARGATTRTAVVEALLALLYEGDLRPTGPRIAARAGVSLRSVFQHFADLDALFATAAERQGERIHALSAPVPVAGTPAARAAALAAQRARVFEAIAPVRRAALLMEPFAPAIATRLAGLRAAQRRELRRVFAPELARLPAAARRSCLAALAALCGFSTWHVLRVHQGLSVAAARQVMTRAITALLR